MNPYLHELGHLLRSRAVLALLVVTLLSGAVTYPSVAGTTVDASGNGFWYESAGVFHLEVWAEDVAGQPIDGVVVELQVVEPPALNGTGLPKLILASTATTNDQGWVGFQVPDHLAAPAEYVATFSASDPDPVIGGFGGALSTSVSLVNRSTIAPQPLSSPFTTVAQGFYSAHSDLLVVWGGPGGADPEGDRVVACDIPVNQSPWYNPTANCQSATRVTPVGTLTGYSTVLPLPPPPPADNRSVFWVEVLAIDSAAGVELVNTSSSLYPGFGSPAGFSNGFSPGPGLLGSFALELSFLLPLLALMVTYWAYVGPRLHGTTESVLSRPVTRRGLFLVRYGTIALVLTIAAVVDVLLLDAELVGVLHEPIPLAIQLGVVGGLAVAALGMVGLTFLLAHALRSAGTVLGLGLAIVLLTSVFWELIPAALQAFFGNPLTPEAYFAIALRSQLFAPSQFPTLVADALTGLPFVRGVDSLAAVGITDQVLVAAATGWLVLPFLLTYWRVVTRD